MNILPVLLASFLGQADPSGPPPAPPPPAAPPAPAPAPTPPPAAASAPFTPKLTVWGFVQAQYSATDRPAPKNDLSAFELRRARLGVKGNLLPEVGYAVLFDGADTSLKDAWASYKATPALELRAGQFKTPFGYEQLEADTRLLWLYNSYVVQALARGRDSRDLGVLGAGSWAVGPVGAELAAALVNGAGPNVRDDLQQKNLWARGGVSYRDERVTARLGASYGHGRQVASLGDDGKFGEQGSTTVTLDDTYVAFDTAGADVTVDTPWGFLAAEWIQSWREVTRYTAPDAADVTRPIARGFYVGGYGKTPWRAGPVARVERYDPSDLATGDVLSRLTLGAYYDLVPVTARLVFNWELDSSDDAVRLGDRVILLAQVIF